MNKKSEYAKNTFILLLGKFATQFISLLLLPLFTHFLIASDYGLIDLYQTYISLFVPVLLLCMDSAVFRFLIDVRNDNDGIKEIVTSAIKRLINQVLIVIVIATVVYYFIDLKYYSLIVIDIIVLMLSNISLQVCRGIGKNQLYTIACIITGTSNLILNAFMIIVLKFGANSILISNIFANLLCTLFVWIAVKIYKYIDFKKYNGKVIKKMLSYSVPLIPNALSWWIVNVSDRTIISFFINTAANGIYTVSCKFSNILNSVFSVFTMSWQESASLHINDKDKDEFFSTMIQNIYKFFVSVSIIIIICVSLGFDIIVGKEYISSYNYIPILVLANSFNVLIGLFGGIYIAKKLTNKMTTTTIAASVINLVINLLFVKKFGLYAASFSTLVAYFVMSIYRYIDIQKYVKIKISFRTIIESILLFTLAFIFYYNKMLIIRICILIIVIILSFYFNKSMLFSLYSSLKNKIRKNRN